MLASLQWVDLAIAIIILISSLISLKRGFFREAISLVIWLLAVVVSIMFHEQLSVLIQPYLESPSLRKVLSIISLFILCLLVGGIVSLLMSQLIKLTGMTGTDRLFGVVFGALRGVIVVVVLLMVGQNMLPVHEEAWWHQSLVIPHFLRLEAWTISMVMKLKEFVLPLLNV